MLDLLNLHCLVGFGAEDFIRHSEHPASGSAANFAPAIPARRPVPKPAQQGWNSEHCCQHEQDIHGPTLASACTGR